MASPKVSILIPLYNAYPYIKEMLVSIKSQTFADWELIVVDDGSTDEGPQLVKSYAESDARITYIKRPEDRVKGACACRNIGLEMAKGEYVIWLDADDIIASYCLQQRVDYLENHSDIDFAVFPALSFIGKPLKNVLYHFGYKSGDNILGSLINRDLPFVVVTNIYRRDSLLNKNIKWDENLKSLQDSDFNISAILAGLKFMEPNLAVDYFIRVVEKSGSISQSIRKDSHLLNHLYYLDKVYNKVEKKKEMDNEYQILLLWFFLLAELKIRDIYNDFIKLKFFETHKFLKFKYRLASKLNFRNHLSTLFFLLLYPKNYVRHRRIWSMKPFKNKRQKIKNELLTETLKVGHLIN